MKLSIVIPAHNEEHRLPPVLEAYAKFFSFKMGGDAEIILVANGCKDATASVAENIAENHSNIRVIDEPQRIGKGGAVILGAKQAVGDYIGFVDADGATTTEEFFRLYEKANGKDGIIASRWMKGADVTIPQRAMRLLSSRLFNGLARILLGLKYKDTQCGAKIFKAEAWEAILPDIGITRFAFDVDVLFQLKRHGYTVREEPTVWKDIEGSKVQFFSSSIDMFLAITRMRLLYSPFRFMVRIYERVFAKIIERLRGDQLFCHATMLFMASMVMNVCNIAFQMVVSRALPKPEYTLLAAFLALFAIIARPLGALSTTIAYYTSLLCKEGRKGAIRRLVVKWCSLTGIPSVILSAICVLFAEEIASYFHLNRVAPVVVAALALPVMFVSPVVRSALRGLQRFGWLSLISGVGGLARLLLGAAFVFYIFPACGWAFAGHVGGMYVTGGMIAIVLFGTLRGFGKDRGPLPRMRLYLIQCFIILMSAAVLMTGDIVLVRHYLPADTDFAFAATLSRMVVGMTAAVITAMFPKVSSTGEFTSKHRNVYYKSLLYTSFFIFLSVVCCTIFPAFMHRVVFRITDPSDHLISLTRWMAIVMSIATLMNINTVLLLAQRRFRLASITILSALMYLVGVRYYHETAHDVVALAGVSVVIAFVVTTVGIIRTRPGSGARSRYAEVV